MSNPLMTFVVSLFFLMSILYFIFGIWSYFAESDIAGPGLFLFFVFCFFFAKLLNK